MQSETESLVSPQKPVDRCLHITTRLDQGLDVGLRVSEAHHIQLIELCTVNNFRRLPSIPSCSTSSHPPKAPEASSSTSATSTLLHLLQHLGEVEPTASCPHPCLPYSCTLLLLALP